MARRSRSLRVGAVVIALLLAAAVAWRVGGSDGTDPAALTRSSDAPASELAGSSSPLTSPQPSSQARVASVVEAPAPAAPATTEETRALTVEVVDASGLPLEGVVLTLVEAGDDGEFAQGLTDAEGRARLEIEGLDFATPRTFRVGAPCMRTTPPSVEFAGSAWPEELVRFVAGPTGRVELSFETGGHPFDPFANAWLNFDTERCGGEAARGLHDDYVGLDLIDPTVVFAHVGLDLCFEVGSSVRGLEFEDVAFDGPRRAGEVVRVDVPLSEMLVRVRGRVVDRNGAPCAVQLVRARSDDASYREVFVVASGPDGRFVDFLHPRSVARVGPRIVIRTGKDGELVCTGVAAWPELDNAPLDGHPTIDLGDVVVAALPRLASGRVLDVSGATDDSLSYARIELRPLDGNLPFTWYPMEAEVADDGRFQIGLEPEPQRFELRARAPGRITSAPIAVVRGVEGVELRLRAGARAHGRMLTSESVDPDEFSLAFECVPPCEPGERRIVSYESHEDGRFETHVLEPGRYSVRAWYSDTELGRREFDVPVVDTLDAPPVTIEPFDLRELVHAIAIRVVGRDGSVVQSGTAHDVTDADHSTETSLDREGRVVLCATTRVRDVVVASPGFATQRFDGVVTGAVLTLVPGPVVRVHVKDLPSPPAGWAYEVALEPEGEDQLAELSQAALERLDPNGLATLHAPCAGPLTLSASVRRGGTRESHVLAVLEHVRVEPNADQPAPVLEIEPDPADVRGTLAQITPR